MGAREGRLLPDASSRHLCPRNRVCGPDRWLDHAVTGLIRRVVHRGGSIRSRVEPLLSAGTGKNFFGQLYDLGTIRAGANCRSGSILTSKMGSGGQQEAGAEPKIQPSKNDSAFAGTDGCCILHHAKFGEFEEWHVLRRNRRAASSLRTSCT